MGSPLNPNAAPFVPMAYRAVEDFSTEWWKLVKTSPDFCGFWLRECFHEEKLAEVVSGDSQLSDISDSFFHPSLPRQKGEKKKKSSGKMDLMAWGADKWIETRSGRPWLLSSSRCSQKAPKIVSLRVSPRAIQQPR